MHICGRLIATQANILIGEDWSACLADFGLSIFSDATASMTTNRGGSLYWMAPELMDPDRFGMKFSRSPASDVYAFGCVCLEVAYFFSCIGFLILSSCIQDDLRLQT
jgi:serine/threonine protein kinase